MGQVAHALLTRPPLSRDPSSRRIPGRASLDLHVLGTPPAFILSQDQTLVFKSLFRSRIAVRFSFPFLPFLPLRRVAGVPRTSLSENPPFPKILFKKFSRIVVVYCSVVKVLSSVVLLLSLATACLYYHSHFALSRIFLNFFRFFSFLLLAPYFVVFPVYITQFSFENQKLLDSPVVSNTPNGEGGI